MALLEPITAVIPVPKLPTTAFRSLLGPAAFLGAAGLYGFIWWRGWTWQAIMSIAQNIMSTTVACLSRQLEHLSVAPSFRTGQSSAQGLPVVGTQGSSIKAKISEARKCMSIAFAKTLQQVEHMSALRKRQSAQRLEMVSHALDESFEMQGFIKDQISEVRGEVERTVVEVASVERLVRGLEGKIEVVMKALTHSVEVQGSMKDRISEVVGEMEMSMVVETVRLQRLSQELEMKFDSVHRKQDLTHKGMQFLLENMSAFVSAALSPTQRPSAQNPGVVTTMIKLLDDTLVFQKSIVDQSSEVQVADKDRGRDGTEDIHKIGTVEGQQADLLQQLQHSCI